MRIDEAFDILNPEHIRAYQHLCSTGMWPENFIVKLEELVGQQIEFKSCWQYAVASKLADEYIELFLSGKLDEDYQGN